MTVQALSKHTLVQFKAKLETTDLKMHTKNTPKTVCLLLTDLIRQEMKMVLQHMDP